MIMTAKSLKLGSGLISKSLCNILFQLDNMKNCRQRIAKDLMSNAKLNQNTACTKDILGATSVSTIYYFCYIPSHG